MIVRMFEIWARGVLSARSQRRVRRHAERAREPLLRDLSAGYATPDTQQFVTAGPSGDYRIFVATPSAAPPAGGFPLLYLLDANASFGTAVDALRFQAPWPQVSGVGPMIVVGVGYPGDAAFDHRRRSFDFTPPLRNPDWKSPFVLGAPWLKPGGAGLLLDFLTGPLLDAICARYPVDRGQTGVSGLSLGGTFALHALATRPEAFRFYAAVSSALWWDGGRVVDELAAMPGSAGEGRAAFIAVGSQEIPGDEAICEMMISNARSAAEAAGRAGVRTTLVVAEGENHQSTQTALMPSVMRAFAASRRIAGD